MRMHVNMNMDVKPKMNMRLKKYIAVCIRIEGKTVSSLISRPTKSLNRFGEETYKCMNVFLYNYYCLPVTT